MLWPPQTPYDRERAAAESRNQNSHRCFAE
jgi:hypothetical protein